MTTLPIDSNERKAIPLLSGCFRYFPAALVGVARLSKSGNDKHNPGEPLHHARGKSTDHGDCILRHLTDIQDLLAAIERAGSVAYSPQGIIDEANALAWRALALSQELHERFAGAPLAPGARAAAPTSTAVSTLQAAPREYSIFTDPRANKIRHACASTGSVLVMNEGQWCAYCSKLPSSA